MNSTAVWIGGERSSPFTGASSAPHRAGLATKQAATGGLSDLPLDLLWMGVLAVAGILQATQIRPGESACTPSARTGVGCGPRARHPIRRSLPSGAAALPVLRMARGPAGQRHAGTGPHRTHAGELDRRWTLPAAVYRLGTAFLSPVAITGGWLALHIPTVGATLGPPTALFHGLIHVLASRGDARAALAARGWLSFGVCLAADGRQHEEPGVLAGAAAGDGGALWRARTSPRTAALAACSGWPRWSPSGPSTAAHRAGRRRPTPSSTTFTERRWSSPVPTADSPPAHRPGLAPHGREAARLLGCWTPRCVVQPRQGPPVLDPRAATQPRPERPIPGHLRTHAGALQAALLLLGVVGCIVPCGATRRHSPGSVLATGWLVGIPAASSWA